jgi:hypothetical protein
VPVEEKARLFVNRILSEDRIQSRTAAKQAASRIRRCVDNCAQFGWKPLATNAGIERVAILNGLDTICSLNQEHYPAVVAALTALIQ